MTRGDGVKILRRGPNIFRHLKRGSSEKIVGLGGGLRKFVYFKTNRRGGPEKLNR